VFVDKLGRSKGVSEVGGCEKNMVGQPGLRG
jgi:hypothetical protein